MQTFRQSHNAAALTLLVRRELGRLAQQAHGDAAQLEHFYLLEDLLQQLQVAAGLVDEQVEEMRVKDVAILVGNILEAQKQLTIIVLKESVQVCAAILFNMIFGLFIYFMSDAKVTGCAIVVVTVGRKRSIDVRATPGRCLGRDGVLVFAQDLIS